MSTDFLGLRVIWPPDGTRPPKHDQDIVFVHGLQHGALSEWQDSDGVCWPAGHLSLDLGTARIFAFGYDSTSAYVRSDGRYAGGVQFKPGEDLWSNLRTRRRHDQVQVPITFVGRGAGCIVIKSALCVSHLKEEQFDPLLRKTKHILLLEDPPGDLSWEAWNQLSTGTSGAQSRGQWKIWSKANDSLMNPFARMARYIKVSASTRADEYGTFLDTIRGNKQQLISDAVEIQRIRAFLERRIDTVSVARFDTHISKHCQGTGEWLFQAHKFSEWASMNRSSPILWLVGPEGSGKSVLCSLVAERLRQNPSQQAVVHLLLSFDTPRSQYNLVTQIALQLLDYVLKHQGGVDAEALLMLPEKHDKNKKTLQVHALIEVLISQCRAVFILIDGLDEIGTKDGRGKQAREDKRLDSLQSQLYSVLSFVGGLAHNKHGTHVRLCCVSQHTEYIADRMRGLEVMEMPLDRGAVMVDIASYLDLRLQQARKSQPSFPFYLSSINLGQLNKAARNNFLLASITIDGLMQASSNHRASAIQGEPDGTANINDVYEEQLAGLLDLNNSTKDMQSRRIRAVHAIAIVAYAKRPLRLLELQEALSVTRLPLKNFHGTVHETVVEEELDLEELRGDCAPFVSFDLSPRETRNSYARISHASAYNYLRAFAHRKVTAEEAMRISANIMAEACLKILSQDQYGDTGVKHTSTQSFYSYAAKYWHMHVDEADSDPVLFQAAADFTKSRHFTTLTCFQSTFLGGHFGRDDHAKERISSTVPMTLASKANMPDLVNDYRHFVGEWSHVLNLGTENGEVLEQCWWGALGERNAMSPHGLNDEENKSFLLRAVPTGDDAQNHSALSSASRFYGTVSTDGNRVTVWKIPKCRQDDGENTDVRFPTRESWIVDGRRPPIRYSVERITDANLPSCPPDFEDNFLLITNPDSDQRIPLADEYVYGKTVRIGDRVFHKSTKRTWTDDHLTGRKRATIWASAVHSEPWSAYSHRKQPGLHREAVDNDVTSTLQSEHDESLAKDDKDNLLVSEGGSDDEVSVLPREASPSAFRSSSESEEVDSDGESQSDISISSAEEFLPETSSGDNEDGLDSDNNLSDSSVNSTISTDEEVEDQQATDDTSDSTSETSDTSSPRHGKSRVRLSDRSSHNVFSDDSSDADADDEDEETSEMRGKPDNEPKHNFSFSIYCDLCGRRVVPTGFSSNHMEQDAFYQCIPCNPGDSYDICSTCYGNGAWCKEGTHDLSECLMHFPTKRYYWKDGIFHHTATPLVKIVAGFDGVDLANGERPLFTPSFRYKHRYAGMLHDSQPIFHPINPLLVYPLDGRRLLFGNITENSYFTHDIPFTWSETGETSGNTCIPISVDLHFSSCGKYLYVLRLTARTDVLLVPLALHITMFTVALSLRDPSSRKPRALSSLSSFTIGSWPRMVSRLPHTVTWTDAYAYISLSREFLRTYRISLCTKELVETHGNGWNGDVCVLSQRVALPRSAQARSVHFFPSNDAASAKVILGPCNRDHPQPPAVLYMKDIEQWGQLRKQTDWNPRADHTTSTESIEEPHVDDDEALVPKRTGSEGKPTLEPVMPIRETLLRQWQTNNIHCPSCFELGIKIGFLRPHPNITFRHVDYVPTAETGCRLEWRVKATVLSAALKAGCQFCCYVASRMLSSGHIRHTTQYIGEGGVSCCAKGTVVTEPKTVQSTLEVIERIDWKTPNQDGTFQFHVEPQHWSQETQSFDKLLVTLPSIQIGGKFGEHRFAPTMIMFTDINDRGEARSITSFIHSSDTSGRGFPECVLELHASLDDAAHNLIDTKPLTTTRGQGENLRVVRAWLKECQTSHPFCGQQSNTHAELPTRLLEIVDAKTVRLTETAGQVGQYVALSYVWGLQSENDSMTREANFRARTRADGIPRDELPAVINDAISVTEKLSIRWIWVDALCMIQDNVEDKHAELGKMSQYYRNSFLTIAASTPSSNIGFIGTFGRCEKHPNSPLPRDLVPLNAFAHIHSSKDAGAAGKVYVREENPYQLHLEPISKRAWTLQECLLAPRVLLFGSRVIWFCQHMTHSDGGVEDWSFDRNDFERTRREFQLELRKLEKVGTDGSSSSLSPTFDTYDLWHRIVTAYSRRALTWSADKLPAVSAVAAEFSRLVGGDYLAGLWRLNLARDLLWTTPEPLVHRPTKWRAPTWSWASVDDAVLYQNEPPKNATLLATIEEAATVPLTSVAPFGEVEGGTLTITAPIGHVNLNEMDESSRKKFSSPLLKDFGFRPGSTEREMLLESLRRLQEEGKGEEEEFKLPDDMVLLFIYGKRDELFRSNEMALDGDEGLQRWMMWGLVLKKCEFGLDGEEVYERVLAFSQVMLNCHEAIFANQETFRIV